MSVLVRVAALAAVCLLLPFSANAFDRSQWKQYGGSSERVRSLRPGAPRRASKFFLLCSCRGCAALLLAS